MSFGSPAADYVENKLDLNRLLVPHPAATYFVRMSSSAMQRQGIMEGDILTVDRSVSPHAGCLVIAEKNNEFKVISCPSRPDGLNIWGVVTSVIRKLA